MFREYVLSIAHLVSSSAGQVQPLRKSLHPYSNKVMSPRSPSQTDSVREDLHSVLMPRVKYNAKNKLFPPPDQKTTAMPSSNLKHQARHIFLSPSEHLEMAVSLPQLDHPTIAKPSLSKHLNKTTFSPLKCLDYNGSGNPIPLPRPKHQRDPDTWAQLPFHPNKLPKVPLPTNHLSKIQQASDHRTEALLYRRQQRRYPSYPESQDNTRIYADYKRQTIPISPLYSKFETTTTTLPLPWRRHSKVSQNHLSACQQAKTSLLQCQDHRFRVQPLPCMEYCLKTKANPLLGPTYWARDMALPSPCPMHDSTTMAVQCRGSNKSERTRTVSTSPNLSSISSQYNQPSSVPSSDPELTPQDDNYKAMEALTPLPHPEQESIFSTDSERQVESIQDNNSKITDSSSDSNQLALLPVYPRQWTKILSDLNQCTEVLQDPNLKAESALNQEKHIEIVPRVIYKVETLVEPDQQDYPLPDIKEEAKTEMKLDEQIDPQKSSCEQAKNESRPKKWDEIPLVLEEQDQTLSVQDCQLEVTSNLYQGTTTLLSRWHRTKSQLGHDHWSGTKKSAHAKSPLDMHNLGKGSSDPKTQIASLSDSVLENKPPYAVLQTTTIGYAQQEKTGANSRFPVLLHQGLKHWNKIPTYNEDWDELSPSSCYHANEVQKLESSWCSRYIKPYTIEGGTISDETVNNIINSIPQKKIKRDMQKILLEKTKGHPTPQTGHSLSLSYDICLICASWIPYGCCHVNEMNYHCKAQLVAIPTHIPGSKVKMGIKFILKLPIQQASSRFCPTFTCPDMHGPTNPLLPFPSPSCPATTLLESPIDSWKAPMTTWFGYLCGTDPCLTERQRYRKQQSFLGKMSEQSNATREEEARGSGGVFKSLLEKFQRKRRGN